MTPQDPHPDTARPLHRKPEREHVHYTRDEAGKVFHDHRYGDNHPQDYQQAHGLTLPAEPVAPSQLRAKLLQMANVAAEKRPMTDVSRGYERACDELLEWLASQPLPAEPVAPSRSWRDATPEEWDAASAAIRGHPAPVPEAAPGLREALEQALDRLEDIWEHIGLDHDTDEDRHRVAQECWFGMEEARAALAATPPALDALHLVEGIVFEVEALDHTIVMGGRGHGTIHEPTREAVLGILGRELLRLAPSTDTPE